MVLEKTLESPLDCKEVQPVHPKGDQSWVFFGRNDAEAETPILWSPNAKNWLVGKDPDAGKDWSQEEKGKTEDEMVGWHHSYGRKWRTKDPLDESEKESEKVGLKSNIQKMKIVASGPITSWQIDYETV